MVRGTSASSRGRGRPAEQRDTGRGRGKSPKNASKNLNTKSFPQRAGNGTLAYQSLFRRKNWAKRLVFLGKKAKTNTGLFKRDLIRNKRGKVVSKRKSAIGLRRYHENHIDLWTEAMMEARADQDCSGMVLCKKSGTKAQRDLFHSTQQRWKKAVSSRMMHMVQKLDRQSQRHLLSELTGAVTTDSD